jgi:hypothetical protein
LSVVSCKFSDHFTSQTLVFIWIEQDYRLAETLSDIIWNIIIKWDKLAQDTVSKQLINSLIVLVQILLKAQAEGVLQIIEDLPKLPGHHYLRFGIGLEEFIKET